ncbi:MAG TPA: hypothetical protein VN867_10530 [Candidatus Binataceae bacterium]|nr:hypothetical protein [Candidatus Binataceae bacterium]
MAITQKECVSRRNLAAPACTLPGVRRCASHSTLTLAAQWSPDEERQLRHSTSPA